MTYIKLEGQNRRVHLGDLMGRRAVFLIRIPVLRPHLSHILQSVFQLYTAKQSASKASSPPKSEVSSLSNPWLLVPANSRICFRSQIKSFSGWIAGTADRRDLRQENLMNSFSQITAVAKKWQNFSSGKPRIAFYGNFAVIAEK
ncbi:hypothetical protein B0H12DRAFT_1080421 [Mycena haematopus]|nr:hypothetical protein B0H12DRAFT_1080421 [Mycena haematopus]